MEDTMYHETYNSHEINISESMIGDFKHQGIDIVNFIKSSIDRMPITSDAKKARVSMAIDEYSDNAISYKLSVFSE